MIKIRYIYTVSREFAVFSKKDLESEIDFFNSMTQEAGEYLYGGSSSKEDIKLTMQYSEDDGKTWKTA